MKKLNNINLFISIMSLILVILYGFLVEENPINSYVCGICWMSVCTLRFGMWINEKLND